MFENILEKIKEYDTIIIHRHIRPDGDCMGSQMGLKYFIKDNFPDKKVYAVGADVPEYISGIGTVDEIDDDIYKNALVFVVDTASEKRICDDRWKTGKYIIKIDHHDDSPNYGHFQYVDPESPANCSILTTIFRSFEGLTISKECATALFFGIVTDTGRFRYRGVNQIVLENAGYLVSCGVDIQKLYNDLYVDEVAELKLQGYVLTHFKTTPNGVAYIYFTKKMMKKFGVTKDQAANLVNSISTIKGSLIWIAFIDQMQPHDKTKENDPGCEIRVRLRSRFVAINDVASNYRGGGHLQAAGATIYGKKEMNNLLADLDARLKKFKEQNPDVQ